MSDVKTILKCGEYPNFSDRNFDLEAWDSKGEFRLEISIEGGGGYYASDNTTNLNIEEAREMAIFINRAIKEYGNNPQGGKE